MSEYYRRRNMFEKGKNILNVTLRERDLQMMRSLFENKIVSREQIGNQFFPGVSMQTVNRRLRKIMSLGLITRTSIIVERGVVYAYRLSKSGLAKIKPMLTYEVKTEGTLSECPLHDIALNDIRKEFEAKDTVKRYYTENVLQTNNDLRGDEKFQPFIDLNSDAMVEVDTKVGVLNLAVEFDTAHKSKNRYFHKLNAYYGKRIVDGVLYICANKHILNTLLKVDQDVSNRRRCKPRVFFAIFADVTGGCEEVVFRNIDNYIFCVR